MKKEHAGRVEKFCAALLAKKLGGAVLDRRDDYYYLTGYTGSDAVLALSAKAGKGWIITDARYQEEARKTARGCETILWKGGFAGFVGEFVKKQKMRAVGYTPHSMTAAFFDALQKAAGAAGKWTDVGEILSRQRAVKSKAEVAAVRAALACAEQAFLTAKARWKAGMTEVEVKNDLEWEMKRLGAEEPSFETIVAVGANASLPHAHAGVKKIQPGKMLLIDFGAKVDRYCSDLTRTLWADEIPAVWAKRYEAVLEAQTAGLAAIRAGAQSDAPHLVAVAALTERGIGEKFTHGLGHGVGLAVHEAPRLSPRLPEELVAGQILTCEPGVYFPGSGGIRTEDMALVTASGAEVLSSLPKALADALF